MGNSCIGARPGRRGCAFAALGVLLLLGSCAKPGAGHSASSYRPRTYYLVLLRRGAKWTAVRTRATLELAKGHMNNIKRLAKTGKLLLAGPVRRGDVQPRGLAGLLLLTVPSLEEAKRVARSDPAVRAGRFEVEVLPWMGPAGLSYPGAPTP